MKTVVITGSARGFGFEMLKLFRENDFNTVICDINEVSLDKAYTELSDVKGKGEILKIKCDITHEEEADYLISDVLSKFMTIDI